MSKQARQSVVNVMKGWLGWSEANGRHKRIIDIYNRQKPLPVGYRMKYTDDWCAATVTAAFLQADIPQIHVPECSCPRMLRKYKEAGRWMEKDSYIPQPGDLVLYDWEDNGAGDNRGNPNHIGMVAGVSGGYIHVIEGNKGNAVCSRYLKLNGRFIRGFCLPDFDQLEEDEEMDQSAFDKMMDNYLTRKAKESPSVWAASPLREAVAKGITDGERPRAFATREEVAVMIRNALK